MINLRDYQLEAHNLIIQNFKQNKKVLLKMMAGGGKSITAGSFIAKYKQFYKFVLIVRKRNLVEQLAEDALETFNLDYSVFMANHEKMDLTKSIQVCSKDTMESRDILPFEGEENVVLIIDECDEFKEYQKKLIKRYSKAKRFFYLGMTATPFNGLDHFDVCIEPIKPKELLKSGVLIDFDYKIPKLIDYSDIEIVNGQFKADGVIKKLDNPKKIAEAFNAWLKFGDNRQTLIFCINKEHSKRVVEYINNYYQKEIAIHCDSDTPKHKRKEAIDKFKKGQIRFLSNIRLFTRGTNIVEIGTIWDQAATLSLNNHIQKLGRGSRKNPFYKDCILIDIANNCINNGGFYTDREVDLNSPYKKTKSDLETSQMRVCEACFRGAEPQEFGLKNICPFCGFSNKPIKIKKLSKYMENKTFLQTATEEQIEQRKMINEYKKELWKKQNLGKKRYRKDIAKEKAHEVMLKKYGLNKLLKIKKTIGLKQESIDKFKRRYEYQPLGGL